MNSSNLNRKDIEDFWRRSNSICDQQDGIPENLQVQVRRMSLAEFTGLNPHQKLLELEAPAWKSGKISQSTLLNSFSNRRRSVLSNEILDSSPSRRLSTNIEEQFDIKSALEKLRSIEKQCSESRKNLKSDDNLIAKEFKAEKKKCQDSIERLQVITKQLNQIPSSSLSNLNSIHRDLLSETVYITNSLSTSIQQIQNQTSVYHSKLISTELENMISSLISFISKLDHSSMSANISTPSRKISLVANSFSQLIANLNILNKEICSI